MPIYEYLCQPCNGIFEELRPIRESSEPVPCPQCFKDANRIMPTSFAAFVYRDGYPRRIPDDGKFYHLGHKVSTLVSSGLIDRVARGLGREVAEVPVGFKWFVSGLTDGSLAFGGGRVQRLRRTLPPSSPHRAHQTRFPWQALQSQPSMRWHSAVAAGVAGDRG